MNDFGWLSLVPPIIAIALALITKEVIVSLLIGILSGAAIFSAGNIMGTLETTFNVLLSKMGSNVSMIVFLALLGALVAVITLAGGSRAYGKWASEKIKTQKGASLATVGLGLLIFIDDYFNCLTIGTVMRPVTDKNGISRAKLAYLIDSTAAPICILAPVSSWAASVITIIGDTGIENPLALFMSSIPFNFYALFTILTVIYFSVSKKEIGSMGAKDICEKSISDDNEIDESMDISKNGKVLDLIIPIVALIGFTIYFMLYTGGYFAEKITLATAFGNTSVNISLVYGAFLAIVVAFIMYIPRKLTILSNFMSAITLGIKSMIPAIMILILAWSIGGISGEEFLNTGGFIGGLMSESNVSLALLPAIVFVVAGFLAFSTGTAWGTFGILIPILVPIIIDISSIEMLPIILGAIFSGSVFGDHCSPISDTTILSAAGAGCKHIVHVSTQIPYAITVGIAAFSGFVVGGFTNNVYISLVATAMVLIISVTVAIKITNKEAI